MDFLKYAQQILFDLDDTLVYCNRYFEMILEQFSEKMVSWFPVSRLTKEEVRSKQVEIDVAGVHIVGFTSIHFPNSLIETYHYFCKELNQPIVPQYEDELMLLGMSVYEQPVEAYPGMVDTLTSLQSQGHELFLYTGGETVIQSRKIEQMKLAQFFQDRIYIRKHKNIDALEGILSSRHFDRNHTWMIGNSLRTDIMPALTAGLNTIHINLPDEWAYNVIELQPPTRGTMYTVHSLQEVPSIIFHNTSFAKTQQR